MKIGQTGIFQSPYEQFAERNGQKFTVTRVIDKDDSTHDVAEVGTMYEIRFADGAVIEAWPEELEEGDL